MVYHLPGKALWVSVILLLLPACNKGGEGEPDNGMASVQLSLSLSGEIKMNTKTTATIAQTGPSASFRGIQEVYLVPFYTGSSPVKSGDVRRGVRNVILDDPAIDELVESNNAHVFDNAVIPTGTNRVLVYGKAPDKGADASKENKHLYGVLSPVGLSDPSGSDDIFFKLEPVLSTGAGGELSEVIAKTDAILAELNNVANQILQSRNSSVVDIFDLFKREGQIMACSYQVFYKIQSDIQTALISLPNKGSVIDDKVRISSAVNALSTVLMSAGRSFPSSYGIPEGSLGFWWNGSSFVRLINGVNMALVDPASYCYPAGLWYYANSALQTSEDADVKAQYIQTNTEWDDVLGYYNDGDVVSHTTRSVAVVDQLQYGVSLLNLSLKVPGYDVLVDASGCPLTGIIVGDQKDVNFQFSPAIYPSPATNPSRFIYDNVVEGPVIGETGVPIYTLVLPTEDDKIVHFALEFQNTTGTTLSCQQGDILPWCKFYLAGELNPQSGAVQPANGTLKSVFSPDHNTTVAVTIESLEKAYNTVPDLHDPQLEIGVVAEMKWASLTPQSITLVL